MSSLDEWRTMDGSCSVDGVVKPFPPLGNLLKMAIEIVSFPMKNGDFP